MSVRTRFLAALAYCALLICDTRPAAAATLNVTDFGACTACFGSDNRTAFANAIAAAAASDIVYIPDGTYTIGIDTIRSVLANKAITIQGQSRAGTVLRIDPALVPVNNTTWRILEITSSNVTVEHLTLDGLKPNAQTVTAYDPLVEHHNGVFVGPSVSNITFRDVLIRDFQGDGIQVYNGVDGFVLEDSVIEYCQRSGLSYTPTNPALPATNTIVRRNTFTGVTAQSIDNEHGPVYGAEVYENTFAGGLNNFEVTISGYANNEGEDQPGQPNRSKDWHVHHNTFTGGIFVIRAGAADPDGQILIEDNVHANVTTKPCTEINRSAYNVLVRRNVCTMSQTTTASVAAYYVQGTKELDPDGGGPLTDWYPFPENVTIQDNVVTSTGHASAFGVQAESFVSVTIDGNALTGPGQSALGYAGVYLRAGVVGRDAGSATVTSNVIRNWGQRGISVVGNGLSGPRMASVTMFGNRIENVNGATAMTQAINFDATSQVPSAAVVNGNVRGCGVSTTFNGVHSGMTVSGSPLALRTTCP